MKSALKNKNIQQEVPYIAYLPYLLIIVCFLVYCNTFKHGFVLDDEAVITKNIFVQKGFAGLKDIFSTFYWRGYWESNAGLYRPLSLIVFAIEWVFAPGNSTFYHVVQVAVYTVMVVALYHMLNRLLVGTNKWLSFCITLLFAVHPLHSEVVANVKSLDEILAFLFFILATNWILKKEKYSWQSCLFLFLALLSKEGAIAFVPVWLLLLMQLKKQSFAVAFKNMLPLMGVTVVWLVIRTSVISNGPPVITYTYLDNSLLACGDWLSQKLTAISILGRSLLKVFYPAGMSYDYSYPQIPCATFSSLDFWLSALSLSALLAVAIYFFKRKPMVSFGIFFFFITSFLTSNLAFNIGATAADRFMFTPLFGLTLAFCYLIFEYTKSLTLPSISKAVVPISVIVAIFAVVTSIANRDWKSNDILFAQHVKHAPNSARAQYNYGTTLLNIGISKASDSLKKAFKTLTLANALDPKNADVQSNLGIANYHLQDYAAAAKWMKMALRTKKDDLTKVNLADTYLKLKQPDSAVILFKEALQHNIYGENSHVRVGAAYFVAKDYTRAAETFRLGTVAYPYNAELWLNYGNALAANGDFKNAISAFEQAYKVNPAQRSALYYLAITYKNMGNMDQANAYMQKYQTGK